MTHSYTFLSSQLIQTVSRLDKTVDERQNSVRTKRSLCCWDLNPRETLYIENLHHQTKSLGDILDSGLTFEANVSKVTNAAFFHLRSSNKAGCRQIDSCFHYYQVGLLQCPLHWPTKKENFSSRAHYFCLSSPFLLD